MRRISTILIAVLILTLLPWPLPAYGAEEGFPPEADEYGLFDVDIAGAGGSLMFWSGVEGTNALSLEGAGAPGSDEGGGIEAFGGPVTAFEAEPAAVENEAQLKAALAARNKQITLGGDIALKGGVTIDGYDLEITGGYTLDVTNTKGTGLTIRNGSLAVSGVDTVLNITGKERGIDISNGSTEQKDSGSINAEATNGIAVYAVDGKSVDIHNIEAKGTGSVGIHAEGKSQVFVSGADASFKVDGINSTGIRAIDSEVSADDIEVTGVGSIGVMAQAGAKIAAQNIKAVSRGISIQTGGRITVAEISGSVSATGANGIGLHAIGGGKAVFEGGMIAAPGIDAVGVCSDGTRIDFYGTGIYAENGVGVQAVNKGEITIDDEYGISDSATYIKTGTVAKAENAISVPTTKNGYRTYTDGAGNSVWILASYSYLQVSDESTLAAALERVNDPEDSANGVELQGSITYTDAIVFSGVMAGIDLGGFELTCTNGLEVTNSSLEIMGGSPSAFNVGASEATGREAVIVKSGSLTTTGNAVMNITGNGEVGGIAASKGSNVDIRVNVSGVSKGVRAGYDDKDNSDVKNGSRVRIDGNVAAAYQGLDVYGAGNIVDITGELKVEKNGSYDALAINAAERAEVRVGGSVESDGDGIIATNGVIVFIGGDVDASGDGSTGISALNGPSGGSSITVDGSVTAKETGVSAIGRGTFVLVGSPAGTGGAVTVSGANAKGVYVIDGGEATVAGDVHVIGSGGIAIDAKTGGIATIDGELDTTGGDEIIIDDVVRKGVGIDKQDNTIKKTGYISYTNTAMTTVYLKGEPSSFACRIGGRFFDTLGEALPLLKNGETLMLLSDVVYSGGTTSVISVSGKNITIDINGFDLTVSRVYTAGSKADAAANYTLAIGKKGRVIFDNSGDPGKTVTINGGAYISGDGAALELSEGFRTNGSALDIFVEDAQYGIYIDKGAKGTATNVNKDNSGNPDSDVHGIYARDKETMIEVLGDVVESGGARASGICIELGARAAVFGNATGTVYGVYAKYGSYEKETTAVVYGTARGGEAGVYSNYSLVYAGAAEAVGSSDSDTYGVYNVQYGRIFVKGDVTNSSSVTGAAKRYGACASGGYITIGGAILFDPVFETDKYVSVGGEDRTQAEKLKYENKLGFDTYYAASNSYKDISYPSYIDVKNTSANQPPWISTPALLPLPDGKVGRPYEFTFEWVGTAVWWTTGGPLPPGISLDANLGKLTGTPSKAGSYSFSIRARAVANDPSTASDPVKYTIVVEDTKAVSDELVSKEEIAFTLAPSHAILTGTEDFAVFTANLNEPDADYSEVVWPTPPVTGGYPVYQGTVGDGGRTFSVQLTPAGLTAGSFAITADYAGKYSATGTVEVVPGGVGDRTSVRLLENKATVNTAKEVGALLPVVITDRQPADFGISAFSTGGGVFTAPETGSLAARVVELRTQDSKTGQWTFPVPDYTATMYEADQRYIEINAEPGARALKNVKVFVRSLTTATMLDAGIISLAAEEKWPKLTIKTGSLNIAFPNMPTPLRVSAADGSVVRVASAAAPNDGIVLKDGELVLGRSYDSEYADTIIKSARTVTVKLDARIDGYKPLKTKPTIKVKVVKSKPKLKLSPSTVTFAEWTDGSAEIRLLSGNKTPFEKGYTVTGVGGGWSNNNTKLDIAYLDGIITVGPYGDTKAGVFYLRVEYEDVNGKFGGYIDLKLKVKYMKERDFWQVWPSSKVRSVTVNRMSDDSSKIADIPISVRAKNFETYDWDIQAVISGGKIRSFRKSPLADAVYLGSGENNHTVLLVDESAELRRLVKPGQSKTYTLLIGSEGLSWWQGFNPNRMMWVFPVNLTISGKKAVMTVSQKGALDISNPKSVITATAKFTNMNTGAYIEELKLLETSDPSGKTESKDFEILDYDGKRFKIGLKEGATPAPGVKQDLLVSLGLGNGQWFEKKIGVTPKQTASKASVSAKAVTLYRAAPYHGERINLNLTTPANVKLGAVALNQASLDACKFTAGGFELQQNGPNEYTIRFKDGIAPNTIEKSGKTAMLKASYSIKLELWAEGTYRMAGGKPVALTGPDGKAKSKPALVTVKVNIK